MPEPHHATGLTLCTGVALAGLSLDELFPRYTALTGVLSSEQLRAVVEEEWYVPPAHEWNIAAHAINERLAEQGLPFLVEYR
jgi:hypothetical protein